MIFETQHLESPDPPKKPQTVNNDYDENKLPRGAVLQKRYEILQVLGEGGMGAVYLARDLRFSVVRKCAIKEMFSSAPDPQLRNLTRESFEREANLLVQLDHPGIPKVSDFFTESVRYYLVMDYVEGEDLENVLEHTQGMLKEDTVLDWAVQVCDVLVYLHNQSPPIIFRDLKPSNVMLRKNSNKIALIDFGIAKAVEATQKKGTMIGTEGYSPPEQYRGVASPRGDIYALGATLHHLLTKRDPRLEPPFTFHEEPVRLLNPSLSEETNVVIMKALEYDLEKRYQSAQVLKDALMAALKKDKSLLAPNPSASTQVLPPDAPAVRGTTILSSQPQMPPQYQPVQPPPQVQYPQYPPPPYPAQYPAYPPQYPPGYPQPPMPGILTGEQDGELSDSILPIWKFKCEDEIRSSPVADKATLYIGVYDNNIYALDLKSGQFKWKYPTEGGIAAKPFVYNDRVIVGSEDRVAYAVSTGGRLIWTCPTEGEFARRPGWNLNTPFSVLTTTACMPSMLKLAGLSGGLRQWDLSVPVQPWEMNWFTWAPRMAMFMRLTCRRERIAGSSDRTGISLPVRLCLKKLLSSAHKTGMCMASMPKQATPSGRSERVRRLFPAP
ncbi:MAG: protein kinase [Anaerolineales bacterium]|nr:protein kinase [Anaerolineales bacterium]